MFLAAATLAIVGVLLAILETGWAKNQIRRLIVRQANQYLTATLEIRRLQGSLVRGIELGDIRLSRDGRTLIAIDDVSLSYSLRELFQHGVVIKRIRLARPRVVTARTTDGRWDLTTLVKREAREEQRTGPGRPIEIDAIEVYDGTVTLADPLDFGAVHAPTQYESLNVTGAFSYEPVRWRLTLATISWRGYRPDLTVNRLSGGIENGPLGILFNDLVVQTPRTAFTLTGRILRDGIPTTLDLSVRADRFAFQEWAGVLPGLKNIAVDAAFDARLRGPLTKLGTDLNVQSTAGSIAGSLVLDTRVPGWHGSGTLDVARLDLAKWLNRSDRPSNITGRVTFDLALEIGRRFPHGSYAFNGPHAEFMHYAVEDLRARGTITTRDILIAEATARAYGAGVRATAGSIGVDGPFAFRFQGTTTRLDLRQVPASVPVPHVESDLTFDYEVSGRFSDPFISGHARFARSQLIGAVLENGTIGTIDTGSKPLRFSGDGAVHGLNLHRLGTDFGVAWLQEPGYAGTVSGRFQVSGAGTDRDSLVLTASGRLERAEVFLGKLSDANVTLDINDGTLRTSYDGHFTEIDPATLFSDPRFAVSITGSANLRATVRDLLRRTPQASDYDIDGTLALEPSLIRGVHLDHARVQGRFRDGVAQLASIEVSGPAIEGHGSGALGLTVDQPSNFQYELVRADLAQLKSITGLNAAGRLSTTGRATGPRTAVRLTGDTTIDRFAASGVDALTMTGQYDVTIPSGNGSRPTARVTGHASFLTLFNQPPRTASGIITLDDRRLGFELRLDQGGGRAGTATGAVVLHPDERTLDIVDLSVALDHAPWHFAPGAGPATVAWSDQGLTISPLQFVGGTDAGQQIGLAGTWRYDGKGVLRVTARHVFLETLQGAFEQPARYGGVVDLDATLGGTREAPTFSGQFTISNGRVQRFSYQRLAGHVDFSGGMFQIDARLDQSTDVWITAVGSVPLGLFGRSLPERELNITIRSSPISLGLIEGVTDVVRNVSGQMQLDVKAVGTSHDPHVQGRVEISNAAFLVAVSGARYKNGRVALTFARERITVEALHLEDNGGRPLDVRGSLGTHELSVSNLEIDATARHFEVIRNELGRLDVHATLRVRGKFEAPQISGDITINSGDVKVDEILERTLFRPYATEPMSIGKVDAVAALNPWDRLALDITLHVPDTLKLTGENIQISPGTPIGLGDINLRVGGDLSLYKGPGQSLSVTGSLDSVSGTYGFQGRRFEVDQNSSINFRGDLNPDIYVSVTRLISGVLTRVTVSGELKNPALTLSSAPPLDASDILSLIVFNTSLNDLTPGQQQELAVRAGTLAAGFLAEPLVSTVETALGLETLEVEPGAVGAGPRVTVGEEIAPGLVARFSRQFGQHPYDQATVEYYLSRLFRIRATFSDAGMLTARSPFLRIERAGIDLLFFFSF